MKKIFSRFRKKTAPKDSPRAKLTNEEIVQILIMCENCQGFVTTSADWEQEVFEFLKGQLKPITGSKVLEIRKASSHLAALYVVDHPELTIREFDHELFMTNIILASLPDDIAKVSRLFIKRVLNFSDRSNLAIAILNLVTSEEETP